MSGEPSSERRGGETIEVTDEGNTTTQEPPVSPPAPPRATSPAPPPHDGGDGGRPGRAWLGVALIVLGGLFLIGRYFPQVSWTSLWPLVIVFAGLVSAVTPGRDGWNVQKMFDGFVTVAFGLVFLTNTLGFVSWGVWGRIFSFWPVLLIAAGIDILSKAFHVNSLRVAGSLLVIATLAYSVLSYSGRIESFGWMGSNVTGQSVDIAEPVAGAAEGKLTLDGGVAQINVGPGSDLISIKGTSPWGTPKVDVQRSGAMASVKARLTEESTGFTWPGDVVARFDVALADSVLWDVRMNTGVADVKADFSNLAVKTLDLRPGVADCDVRLGAVPDGVSRANAVVRSGVSAVTLRVPKDAQGRVQIESGLSGTNVRGGFSEVGTGVWETQGYRAAKDAGDPVWMIIVRSGVGAITIDTY